MAFRVAVAGMSGVSGGNTSYGRRLGSLALFGVKAGAVMAFSAFTIAIFASMQAATVHSAVPGKGGFETSLGLRPVVREANEQRLVRITRFSRLGQPSAEQVRSASLTDAAIRKAHQRNEMRVAMVRDAQKRAAIAAVAKSAEDVTSSVQLASANAPSGSMLTALAEHTPSISDTGVHQRFDLILNGPVAESAAVIPASIPLPVFRPTVPQKPSVASTPENPKTATVREMAFMKPERPLPADNTPFTGNPARGRTAVYEIETGTVHMPGGEKLEAHSGIGKMRDNPDFVHVKMRGATPPSSYKLTMREALFHGIEAIRLTPENGVKPHGRDGLLAHTYMLARRGESNGCVVFREYPRFLAAFKRGEVNRMVVVPRLESRPARSQTLASLFSSNG